MQTADGLCLLRRIGGLRLALTSRGSMKMLQAPLPYGSIHLFNAEMPVPTLLRSAGFVPLVTPATIAEWDISGPKTHLRRSLKQKWRNQLNAAEAHGLKISVTRMPPDANHWLLKAEQRQSRQRRYRTLPHWVTLAYAICHPRDAVLIEARHRGEPVAGMIFLRHGPRATYHIAFATPEARQLNAHRALLWHTAQHFQSEGVTRLDLGTFSTDTNPGLARFKLGTGAKARQLGGTWLALPGLSQALVQFRRHVPSGQNA